MSVAKREIITTAKETVPVVPVVPDESSALISMIERAARDPAVDIDKMERLYLMKERADATRAKAAYLSALSKLQADLPAAERKGTGHNAKKYARFEDLVEVLKPILSAHGFSLTYRIEQPDDKIKVIGVLGHEGGHSEETSLVLAPDASGNKQPVHAVASAVSYGKRYVALTLTGMATQDDDDAKAAVAGATIGDEQELALRDMIEATESNIGAFCKYLKIEALKDLRASDFDRAVSALKKKAEAR